MAVRENTIAGFFLGLDRQIDGEPCEEGEGHHKGQIEQEMLRAQHDLQRAQVGDLGGAGPVIMKAAALPRLMPSRSQAWSSGMVPPPQA